MTTTTANTFTTSPATKQSFKSHLKPYAISSKHLDEVLWDFNARMHYSVHQEGWCRLKDGTDHPTGWENINSLDTPHNWDYVGLRVIVTHTRTGYVVADYIEWAPAH
jgi:hypothetical protein